MSPRTPDKFAEIRQEKKELIMKVALELFADHGYHSTSVSLISGKAGISKGLMYNYFKSKEELLKEIILAASEKIFENFDPDHDGILTKNEFFHFIRTSFRLVRDNMPYWRLYMTLALQVNITEEIIKNNDLGTRNISTLLYRYFKNAGFEDPEGEILIFSCIMKGALVQYLTTPDLYPSEYVEQQIINYFEKVFNNKLLP